jgi:hypothetical protein
VGWFSGSPPIPDPDERLGWITNVGPFNGGAGDYYSKEFRAQWPEVEDEAAEEREESPSSQWSVAVPHDLLTMT